MSACVSCGCRVAGQEDRVPMCAGCLRSLVVVDGAKPATSIVDMGDGTVHVAATVRLEDVDALVARIRDVAAAAARRSA